MSLIPTVLTLVAAGILITIGWSIVRSVPVTMTEYGFSEKELTIW